MSKYIPPSRRNSDTVYVTGKKKQVLDPNDFPALSSCVLPPTVNMGAWSTKIDIDKLKSLRDKKVNNDKIQKIGSIQSFTESYDNDNTDDDEDYYSEEYSDNKRSDYDDEDN